MTNLTVTVIDYEGKELTPEEITERISALRKLCRADEELSKLNDEDSYLLRYLFPTNFNVEEAFKAAKRLYKYLEEESDWLPSSPVEELKKYIDMKVRFVLPYPDRKGKKIVLAKHDTLQPSKLTLTDLVKYENTLIESFIDEIEVQANGVAMLVDVHGTSWRIISWLSPNNVRKFVKRLDNILLKDFEFHIVRTTSLMSAILKIIMPVLPQKIKDKMYFHYNDFDSLHKHISPEYLPKEYGGTLNLDLDKLNEDFLSRSKETNKRLEEYKIFTKQ